MNGSEDRDAPNVTLEKVSFSYGGAPLFSELDFTMAAGRWTCLLGRSGCGKSTLLKLISGGIQKGIGGAIRIGDGGKPKGAAAWMAQKDLLLPWLSVLDNVLLGDRLRGALSREKRARAQRLLRQVGLADCRDALPATLSGGMRQRVALARTLMEDRPVILMDEPFSSLDALTRTRLQALAAAMLKGATVLLVTHDPLEALRLGHRVHVMGGRPATIGKGLKPPGAPPRDPADPALAAFHADLLKQLLTPECP